MSLIPFVCRLRPSIVAGCLAVAAPTYGLVAPAAPADSVSIQATAPAVHSELLAVSQIRCRPCGVGITVVNVATGKRVTLTSHAGWEDDGPAWSPDGARIAFSRTTNGSRSFQIYVMRSDGRNVRRITSGRFDEGPAWSPNGKLIAFHSSRGIELVRPDGTGRRMVPGASLALDPAWAPDGRHLTFAQGAFVWTAGLDGRGRHRLVRGREPVWSPSGRVIAYVPPDGGIATIPASGGKSRFLSPGLQPAWDPDSDRIAYTRWPPSNEFSVWVMGATGGGRRLVMHNAREPSWRP